MAPTLRTLTLTALTLLLLGTCAMAQENGQQATPLPPLPPASETTPGQNTDDIPELPSLGTGAIPPDFGTPPFEPDQTIECLCKRLLAAVSCKEPADYNFVGEQAGVLIFNSFYATGYEDFYCRADDKNRIVLGSPAWNAKRLSFGYSTDPQTRCLSAEVSRSFCNRPQTVSCCE